MFTSLSLFHSSTHPSSPSLSCSCSTQFCPPRCNSNMLDCVLPLPLLLVPCPTINPLPTHSSFPLFSLLFPILTRYNWIISVYLSLSVIILITLLSPPTTRFFTNLSIFLPLLSPPPPLWTLASQAGAPTPSDPSPRQQSPPSASPLSRSNLCSLVYSAPSGMAVVSGKFSDSS